jgi:hypothetical protein
MEKGRNLQWSNVYQNIKLFKGKNKAFPIVEKEIGVQTYFRRFNQDCEYSIRLKWWVN